ncbi:conserved oligomeric Golgi complex component [Physocladia obscura]|uniref:Conserved oligomeric Golgi complex subunit 8 n=1 Tax=Physocladia obscura TaxID=109957 RepID=A0AAD5XBT7_9FUNG|nr:conserved oligomeric Golgi complex component [Physocladia obscura]
MDATLGLSLSQLRGLPRRLSEEEAELSAQLAALAAKEHRAFLRANACARRLAAAAAATDAGTCAALAPACERLKAALSSASASSVPATQADSPASAAHEPSPLGKAHGELPSSAAPDHAHLPVAARPGVSSRPRQALLRANFDQLLDLVAIPPLFDAFVRQQAFEDALDLASFVHRLTLRHPHVAIIKLISAKVAASTKLMLAQLVAILRSNAKLPMCIRVIGYLRRMELYPESELRFVFLQQKDAHLRSLLDTVSDPDPAEFLKRYIEISRESFFDIITQYKAIFADSSSNTSSIFSSSISSSSSTTSVAGSTLFYAATANLATSAILSSYVCETITQFTDILTTKLALINDTQALHSLLTQTMYYGMSLGRVGVDFRTTVSDIFISNIVRVYTIQITDGISAVQSYLANTPINTITIYVKPTTTTATTAMTPAANTATATATVMAPPAILQSYPPLAHTLNVFYAAFNSLRNVAAAPTHARIHVATTHALLKFTNAFADIGSQFEASADASANSIKGSPGNNPGSDNSVTAQTTRYREFCEAARVFVDVGVCAVLDAEARLFGLSNSGGGRQDNEVQLQVAAILEKYVVVVRRDRSVLPVSGFAAAASNRTIRPADESRSAGAIEVATLSADAVIDSNVVSSAIISGGDGDEGGSIVDKKEQEGDGSGGKNVGAEVEVVQPNADVTAAENEKN